MKEVKCEHCGHWTDGTQEFCQNCGKRLNEKHIQEREKRENAEFKTLPFIKINKDEPFMQRGYKYVIYFFQLVFASILSVVAAIASSTVH